MTNRRMALWAVAAVITLLVVAEISIPKLTLTSRKVVNPVSYTGGLVAEQQGLRIETKLRFIRRSSLPPLPPLPTKS
jgi:hypothetical protein